MNRRLTVKLMVGLLVCGAALVVFCMWSNLSPHRISQEDWQKVELGMSRKQVMEILGAPGDYGLGEGQVGLLGGPMVNTKNLGEHAWAVDEYVFFVSFDDAGRVVSKMTEGGVVRNPTVFDRILRWLHLR